MNGAGGRGGATRSGSIREASTHYLTTLDDEAAKAARAERIGRALAKMRTLAPVVGAHDTARVIRELRDTPPRWERT